MIELKPNPENLFSCPVCGAASPAINETIISSMHAMADCTCMNCRCDFYQAYPVSHAVDTCPTFTRHAENQHLHSSRQWYDKLFVKSIEELKGNDVAIEKRKFRDCQSVIILNALDFLYGHVLLKLFQAQYHLENNQDLGLVVIIPKSFTWMIPEGCAEAWIVDLKLHELSNGYTSIQKFITSQFSRFTRIFLSRGFSHPDCTELNIAQFTGIKPFNLEAFTKSPPTVTFILREDRWWYSGLPDYWFYRLCRKLKLLQWGNRKLASRQNRLVKKTIRRIKKELPETIFHIAGLGRTGDFGSMAIDKRSEHISPSIEREWCRTYSRSHVVIGVHGSNMLLPTAFAAGCVEILPLERYGNIVQDISVRYNDRKQLFFYRFVEHYAPPRSVSDVAISMIRDFELFNRNMCINIYKEESDTPPVRVPSQPDGQVAEAAQARD